jgi:hypothetical protein
MQNANFFFRQSTKYFVILHKDSYIYYYTLLLKLHTKFNFKLLLYYNYYKNILLKILFTYYNMLKKSDILKNIKFYF